MKFSRLFVAALAAVTLLSLGACTSEENDNPGGKAGEETYAGFNITLKTSGAATRADGKDVTSSMEQTINSIGVYIWDTSSGLLHYDVIDVVNSSGTSTGKFTTQTNATTGEVTYSGTVTVKTTIGTKDVLVVANPTTAVTSEIASRTGAIYGAVAFGVAEDNFFNNAIASRLAMVLSGVKRNVDINATQHGNQTTAIETANLIPVTIDRNLAKVVVRQNWTAADVVGGSVSSVKYALIAEANDAYFLPQGATLYGNVPATAVGNSGDPYFVNNFSPIEGIADGTYQNVLANNTDNTLITANGVGFYCFENKPSVSNVAGETPFRRGNTTAARIKLTFKPETVVKTCHMEAGNLVVDTTEPGVAGVTFYIDDINKYYWTEGSMNAAIAAGYTTANFDVRTNGVCYYTIVVQDDTNVWGVERNHLYALDINAIKGPGVGAEPNEEKEPYTEDAYMSIAATALNWDFQASGHQIQ